MASQVAPARAEVSWTQYTGEVTLEDARYVVDAWVIKDGSTYEMWYTHGKADVSLSEILDIFGDLDLDAIVADIAARDLEGLLDTLAPINTTDLWDNLLTKVSTVIGYATSTNGRTWTIEDEEVLSGTNGIFDSVGAPCVIKDGDTYKMWYTRVKSDLTQTDLDNILDDLAGDADTRKAAILDLLGSVSTVIGYATLDTGTDWDVEDDEVLPSGLSALRSVGDPCVIKDVSTYKMWYTRGETDLSATDLAAILADTAGFDIDALMDLIDGSATVIGYAISDDDGASWTVVNDNVFPGSTAAWESAANPSVIKSGGTYEMWYTNAETDLIRADLSDLLDEIVGFDIVALWNTLETDGLDEFLEDLVALDTTTLEDIASASSTVIGYATSGNGTTWAVVDADDISGETSSLWSSVAAPCVVKSGSNYYAWYLEGIEDLTLQGLLDIALGEDLPIGYASYTAPAGPGIPPALPPTPEELEQLPPDEAADVIGELPADEAAAILEEVNTEDAASIVEELATDTAAAIIEQMSASAAASIMEQVSTDVAVNIVEAMSTTAAASVVEEMATTAAANVIENVTTNTAAKILEQVAPPQAAAIMQELTTAKLTDVIPKMTEEALTERLPGLTPEKLYSIDPEVLFEALPNVPTEQLVSEEPPQPPAEAEAPVVVYTTPSGARYMAIRTWAGEWVVVVGTPPPLSEVMIKTKTALANVETTIEIFDTKPSGVASLPSGQKARAYFTVEFANAEPEDIEVGYITFYVEKSWVEANSVNLWAVFLNRYDPDLGEWISLPTKRVKEDSTKVYYTAAIPLFSTFAITGSETVPTVAFKVSNLDISPAEVAAGEAITIEADVTNTSATAGVYVAILWIDSTVEAAQNVSLQANEKKSVSFSVTKKAEGSYEVRVDRLFGSFEVTKAAPKPAAFTVGSLAISPAEVDIGGTVSISVNVANTGDLTGTYTITLKINGEVVETKEVTLAGGASKTVTFITFKDKAGSYSVDVNGIAGSFKVKEAAPPVKPPPKPINWWLIGGIIAGVLLVGFLIWWFAAPRRE
jgi:PGF-pre-PGF domain-containing protein